MKNRVFELEGVHNFRDYGGYAARDGTRIRTGLLWRSGQHVDATAEDLEQVDGLGLQTVIDLRGNSERARFPCARSPGFSAELIHCDGETAGAMVDVAPHIQASQGAQTVEEAHARMVELNRHMPFRPMLVESFIRFFSVLAQRDAPSLIHCVAGKDRTGLAVGLVHHLLGVHEDDIMEDFMLTNSAGNIERRIAAGAATIRHHFGDAPEEVVRTIMGVHPSYLGTAFATIRERHGSIDAYLAEVIGVTPVMRGRIEENFLV